jgi:long-subunit fatty acid transport protein
MKRLVSLCAGAALVSAAGAAAAENALESPSLGVNQMSRGGAWLARADDPLATYFNPAAIVRNPTGVHLGAQLMFRSQCFERADSSGAPVAPGGNLDTPPPGEICAEGPPFPNPQLAATFRIHKQLGLGIGVVGPHAAGNLGWTPTVRYVNRFGVEIDAPSPARYLLLENDAILLFPTLSLSYAPIKSLSFGAGFTWGIASFGFSNAAEAASPARCADPTNCPSPGNPQPDDFAGDIYARIDGFDGFVPGFVASVLYSPSRRFDVAGWYRFSDAIRSKIDLHALAPYYTPTGSLNPSPSETNVENAGTFELQIPMEARIGVRYHHPRRGAQSQDFVEKHQGWARDAFSEDVFDIELDATWAHNSQIDKIDVQFNERHAINGTSGGRVPLDASIPHPYKDVIGVRLGGEYVPIPDFLALRLGGFFESRGVSAQYLHPDFHLSERVGIAGGAAVRFGPVDLSVAYQHTFFFPLDNGGDGRIKGISGDATVPAGDFRTRQAVNGGRATASLDEIGLALTYNYFLPTL